MGLDLFHVVLTKSKEHEYFTIEQFADTPEFIQKHRHLFFEVEDDEYGITLAAYWKEKGFQRKGMRARFYEEWEIGKLHFDIASVKKAATYLDLSQSRPELPDSFIRDFINNFIEGESIFFTSW